MTKIRMRMTIVTITDNSKCMPQILAKEPDRVCMPPTNKHVEPTNCTNKLIVSANNNYFILLIHRLLHLICISLTSHFGTVGLIAIDLVLHSTANLVLEQNLHSAYIARTHCIVLVNRRYYCVRGTAWGLQYPQSSVQSSETGTGLPLP